MYIDTTIMEALTKDASKKGIFYVVEHTLRPNGEVLVDLFIPNAMSNEKALRFAEFILAGVKHIIEDRNKK